MIALATNTNTADRMMGNTNDIRGTIATSLGS